MNNLTILLSAAGSPTMPGLLRCFRDNGERNIRIVGMDMAEDASIKQLVDVFYHVPAVTEKRYCDRVLEICKKEKIDIYFPNISAEIEIVSKRKDDFFKIGTILSVSGLGSINIANNKLRLYEFLQSKGIEVPKYYGIHSIEDFHNACRYLGYPDTPVCLKIVNGSGSRGVRIIDATKNRYRIFVNEKPNTFFSTYEDMVEILNEADNFPEMLMVKYLPGNEYTVDLLAENGEVLYMVGRENTVSLMSIAQESVVQADEEAYEMSKKIVSALMLDGNIGFDFMRDINGKPVLMDLNPRITATVSIIAAAGINLPYLRVKQLLGETLPTLEVSYGVKLKRRYQEWFCDKDGNEVIL